MRDRADYTEYELDHCYVVSVESMAQYVAANTSLRDNVGWPGAKVFNNWDQAQAAADEVTEHYSSAYNWVGYIKTLREVFDRPISNDIAQLRRDNYLQTLGHYRDEAARRPESDVHVRYRELANRIQSELIEAKNGAETLKAVVELHGDAMDGFELREEVRAIPNDELKKRHRQAVQTRIGEGAGQVPENIYKTEIDRRAGVERAMAIRRRLEERQTNKQAQDHGFSY